MTTYTYESIAVYTALGGALRLASGVRAFTTDPTTGAPVDATQGARVAPYVDADDAGDVSFTAESWPVRLTNGATFEDVWPIDAAGPDDATVAGLVGAATATQTALDGRYMAGSGVDATVAALVGAPGSATGAALDDTYATLSARGVALGYASLDASAKVPLSQLPAGASASTADVRRSTLTVLGSPKSGNLAAGHNASDITTGSAFYQAFPGFCSCADGSLLAVWRKATSHGGPEGTTAMSRSIDFGTTWSAAWAPAPTTGMLIRLASGRIALIGQAPGTSPTMHVEVAYSDDHGVTWGASITIPFTHTGWTYYSGNLVELTDGTQVAMGYGANTGDTGWSVRVMRSTNGGVTWTNEVTLLNGVPNGYHYSEGTLGLLPDGSVMAMIRSADSADTNMTIYRVTSADGGLTWSAGVSAFAGWGRPAWVPLTSGGVVVTYRRLSDRAHAFRVSWDAGVTWQAETQMATAYNQSVYSQIEEIAPGLLGVVYADDISGTVANMRFKYLIDGVGITPLGDMKVSDTGWMATGWTLGSGWSGVAVSGYAGLSWRLKAGYVTVFGIASKASFAANEMIGTLPRDLWPDRSINNGRYSVYLDGTVHVVAAGTTSTLVEIGYPL